MSRDMPKGHFLTNNPIKKNDKALCGDLCGFTTQKTSAAEG